LEGNIHGMIHRSAHGYAAISRKDVLCIRAKMNSRWQTRSIKPVITSISLMLIVLVMLAFLSHFSVHVYSCFASIKSGSEIHTD